jgi:hypothetical protein
MSHGLLLLFLVALAAFALLGLGRLVSWLADGRPPRHFKYAADAYHPPYGYSTATPKQHR